MLRTMLEERFGLVLRRDPTGKASVYTLTMAREDKRLGPAIRPGELPCSKPSGAAPPISDRQLRPGQPVPCGLASNDTTTAGGGLESRMVALTIQRVLGEEVFDRTGLSGTFDFYLQLPPSSQEPAQQKEASIFTTVQEELGMKLQREEITRDVFIVENLSRPTPN